MKISTQPSAGWRLREAPFTFQTTYVRPLGDLPKFVNTLLKNFEVSEGTVSIEQIIFEPKVLIWYLRGRGFLRDEGQLNKAVIHAENKSEVAELLECVFGQWADFAFIPSPNEFAIYADHDEYTTIFAASAESLSLIRSDIDQERFKTAEGWTWTGPRSPGAVEEGKANG